MKYHLAATMVLVAGFLGSLASAPETPIVFMGRLVYVEPRTREQFEDDRTSGAHDNSQTLVVAVEKVLVGETLPQRIMVGVKVNNYGMQGVQWWTRSYGILDPATWKEGSKVLVVVRTRGGEKEGCFPSRVVLPKRLVSGEASAQGTVELYEDPGLERFRGLTVHCAAGGDTFLIGE